jgi:hypothetical protein
VADRQPVRATADGKLIGVLVTASDFSHNPERAPRTYDVAIEDCRLTPSFIAAQKGDSLRITNRVNFPFMPTFGPTALVETLVPGQKLDVPLNTPGVNDVLCGFTAPCGRTDVVVLQHPLYAVTDEHGDFRIDDFPVGETVHVNAWHPLFDAQELSVRVESGSAQKLDFVITPVAGSELAASPTQATQAPASSKP